MVWVKSECDMMSFLEAAAHHADEPKAPEPDPKVKPSTPLWLDGKPCLASIASFVGMGRQLQLA
jgi:hypothetical protein